MKSSSEAAGFRVSGEDAPRARWFSAEAAAGSPRFEPDSGPPPPDPERLCAEAFEAGRQAGREELPWHEAEALKAASVALETAAERLEALRREGLGAQRELLIELALEIAERVVARELAADPGALVPRLAAALAELPAGEPASVQLSAADHALLAAGEGGLLASLGAITIEVDPTLSAGDAWVRAGAASVDARLASVLERVRSALDPALAAPESAAGEAG